MPKLAFVGCAHIHTPGFVNAVKERGLPVAGVWDHDAARAAMNAEKLGAPVRELDDLLSEDEVHSVIICSETDRHLELVSAVAAAGKHLFVEKPLGMTGPDANAMADAIEAAGLTFTTGYGMRANARLQYLKKLVDEGFFGDITRVRQCNCHSGALGGWFDGEWRWMADVKQAGVGGYGDLGTHGLDALIWLFGEVEAATGAISNGTARYPGCDELGEGMMLFKSGVIGTLAAGWDDVANPVTFQVCGTKGHVLWGEQFLQAGPDGKFSEPEIPAAESAGFGAFLDWFEGKPANLVGAREAAYRCVVMDAIYAGAKNRTWVTL